jgi:NADPH:quinone reductase-like Zn-dependent oxidoreductase
MEAYRIDRFGSVDGIVLRSSEDPRPGLKEILMRVRASSLNYRDFMVLKGGGRGPTKVGVVPLSDGAGEVAAIGGGVTRAPKPAHHSSLPFYIVHKSRSCLHGETTGEFFEV